MAIKLILKLCMIFLAFTLLVQFASANNCTSIYNHGNSDYRADIVIIGHGWTESELGAFYSNSKEIADSLLTYEPYSNYSDMINIWYVNQSADLNCVFPGAGCNYALASALASQCPYDKMYVLVNDSRPFGSGGLLMAQGSSNSAFKDKIFAHEIGGHSFGELMDEYVYFNSSNGSLYFSGANCATPAEANWINDATACTKWNTLSGTGCYAGCSYPNLYRPTDLSIMKDVSFGPKDFNSPSQKQIEKMIDKFTNLTIDYNPKINPTMLENETQEFNITKANESDNLIIRWYVNDVEKTASENQTSFSYTCKVNNPKIKVNVSYRGISESYIWNVSANVLNIAPEIKSFSPSENVSMNENSHTHFSASAEDYNEDALTYSWKLDGVEKSTSQSWTYNADYNSAGNYNVTVTVSDGQLTASQEWNLTVQNVNRAPVLDNIADITAYEGDTITLNPSASDADGESIAYTYSEWMDSNSKPANYSDAGIHSVTVTASDGNLSDTKQIAVTILNSYEFRTAIADRETKERLEGAAAIAGTEKSVDKTNSTIFDYAHSDVEYNIVYSSSGYQTDNYPIYFDNRLADCAQGTDCLMEGAITSDCKWKAEHLGWLCRLTKEGWEYASYFDFVPSENAAKRIDYMIN